MFVETNHVLCRNKSMLVMTHVCHEKYLSCHKSFVITKIFYPDKSCCGKHTFVMTKDMFTRLLRQKLCRDKNHTCGSSRQWYASKWPLFLQMFIWWASVLPAPRTTHNANITCPRQVSFLSDSTSDRFGLLSDLCCLPRAFKWITALVNLLLQ